DRIKDQEKQKRRISDIQFWPALDQNGTPQCWSNGVAGAAATCRVIMGLPYVQLSPASVACPISNGQAAASRATPFATERITAGRRLRFFRSTPRGGRF